MKLAADSAGDGLGGVNVGEESLGVLLNLLDGEALAGVLAIGDDTGLEGALQAARAGADLATLGVGEGNAARKMLAWENQRDSRIS